MRFRIIAAIGSVLATTAIAAMGAAQVDASKEPEKVGDRAPASDDGFLRVQERPGESLALQVATRRYFRAIEGSGTAPGTASPSVTLVSVAHIGDASMYEELQNLLDAHDLVLYESVKPPGAIVAGGTTDEERMQSTRSAIAFIARVLESHRRDREAYPACLDDLQEFAAESDARLGHFVGDARLDAWKRPLRYVPLDDGFTLMSLGRDGQEGGEGPDADLQAPEQGRLQPLTASADDGLQAELARTLGLRFQLDAIDYDRPTWRCSDMTVDELDRALKARGVDFAPIQGALAGSSIPARIVRMLLGLVRLVDRASGGAAADMIKVVLIEMLGDSRVVDQALVQFGQGLTEVIIGQRNQVVIDDLKSVLDVRPALNSIAVLYGGGHMPDLARRLAEMDYQPAGEPVWITAISVDLRRTNLDPAQLRQIRFTLRNAMRQQMLQAKPRNIAPVEGENESN